MTTDLFTKFLKDWTSGMERTVQEQTLPVCAECSAPFSGPDYGHGQTHICGSCVRAIHREEDAAMEQRWEEAHREY